MNLQLIDSHCHPQLLQYDADLLRPSSSEASREEVITRAQNAGVGMICVGTGIETSKQAIELAEKYENIWATVGLHPNDASKTYDILIYHNLLKLKESKVVAVGEVGLDYYRTSEPEKQEQQKEVFKQFLELAIQYDKPVIIHARDAAKGSTGQVHPDIFKILSLYSLHDRAMNIRGVAHSFTGSINEAKKYLDLGFYLGFNGIITFARQYDEMVKFVPLDRILLETDAPYLAPEPYRGKRNEPAYIFEVAKKLAELKNISIEKIVEQTTQNCTKLFKIGPF